MGVSVARAAAFEILLRVEREASYASELLHSEKFATLESRDHGLATELVMGVLRWRSLLDQKIAVASSQKLSRLDSEVLTALRLGVYQLLFLSRVPERAAIFESVELVRAARKRSAATFVNAVLRSIARESRRPDILSGVANSADVASLAENSAHPHWLVARWIERYGLERARSICIYDQTVPETTIHIHDYKSPADATNSRDVEAELAAAGVQMLAGRLLSSARRMVAGDVSETAAYRDGRVSIQDEASQMVALLASGSINNGALLDCCAAPGGKTSLLARRNPGSKVFAADIHPHRARLLKSLSRSSNVRIVAADACKLPFSLAFNRILADVPCSGTGTLARNPEIKWRLTPEDLKDLQLRQIEILKSAFAQLAVGGRLVYSTCSLESEENEDVVGAVLDGSKFAVVDLAVELERLRISGEMCWKDISSLLAGPYLRTIPGVHPCDGFFAAMIERKSANENV